MDSLIIVDKTSITQGMVTDDILFLVEQFILESNYNIIYKIGRAHV